MNDSRVNKVLKFEGAGWSDADTSKATDMTNCRVRTTFINDKGEEIYLEMGCYDNRVEKSWCPPSYRGMRMPWRINFIFFTHDIGSVSPRFVHTFKQTQEFTKENVLRFVNRECDASFEAIEVINWEGDRANAEWDGFSHTGKSKDDFHLKNK